MQQILKCFKNHYPKIIALLIAITIIILSTLLLYEVLTKEIWSTLKTDPEKFANVVRGLGLGIGAAIGLPFLIWQAFQRERTSKAQAQQAKVAVDNQLTETFTKAIEQLGDDSLTIRLGGIYALERISKESDRDYWPIMDILADFVRQETAEVDVAAFENLITQKEAATQKEEIEKLEKVINDWVVKNTNEADVLAAMKVMGRGKQKLRPEENQDDVQGFDLRYIKIVGLDLTNIDYSNAIASNACFLYVKLNNAKLSKTSLFKADLYGANLLFTDLSEANLERADLMEANLSGADLERAHLALANLESAILFGADLERANLSRANLEWAYLDEAHLLGTNLTEADLQSAVLTRTNFSGANLHSANLSEAKLYRADLNSTDLYGANLKAAHLAEAHLRGTNLTEADLQSAVLTHANLTRANLVGTNLSAAKLPYVDLEGAIVERTNWLDDLVQPNEPTWWLKDLQKKYWIDPNKPRKDKGGNIYYMIEQRPQSNES